MYLKTIKEVFFVPIKGAVVRFSSFYKLLTPEQIDRLYDMALLELGLNNNDTYTSINPLGLDTLAEDNVDIIRNTIFRFFLVRVGYDPRKAIHINLTYQTDRFLAFESVFLNEGDALHNRYEYLLSKRKTIRELPVELCRVNLSKVPHFIFNIPGLDVWNMSEENNIMCYAFEEVDGLNDVYLPENKIFINQPREFVPAMFRVNDRGYVYDVMYSRPKHRKKED